MSDDTVALACWMDLMADQDFAVAHLSFQISAESWDGRKVVRWYPRDHQ